MRNYTNLHQEMLQKFNFNHHLESQGIALLRKPLSTLQINVGKLCNQACHHCHVDASPKRTEQMSRETAERLMELLAGAADVDTVDITGGAPELNANFRYLVKESTRLGKYVMDRCNLTVLLEPGQETLAEFLAEHRVEIVASLPCYLSENVNKQRGDGVFEKSIEALQLLNSVGYGKPNTGLKLNLVYNPVGGSLPPPQAGLEAAYKERLKAHYDIEFNNLFTITNMPISRFAQQLKREGQLDDYMATLTQAFNPSTVDDLMCRSLISVSWQGDLYDCDFNQMLEMPIPHPRNSIWDIASLEQYHGQEIATGAHCFGCTAGTGSSCGGALVS